MTIRVHIHVDADEPRPVEVHRLYIGKYPPSDQKTILHPGGGLWMYVWPGNEILVRECEPEEST